MKGSFSWVLQMAGLAGAQPGGGSVAGTLGIWWDEVGRTWEKWGCFWCCT